MSAIAWPELFVIDVEGNGQSPPDLVEVAALPVRFGTPETTTAGAWQICPPRPVTPFAARVHGLTDRTLADSPAWDQVRDEVAGLLGTAWVCAHNAHVDYGVLRRHMPDWSPVGVLDTLRLARATYSDLDSYSLDALIEHERLDLSNAPAHRHRATYDAYATAVLLLALARHYPTWNALTEAAVPPALPGHTEPPQAPTLW